MFKTNMLRIVEIESKMECLNYEYIHEENGSLLFGREETQEVIVFDMPLRLASKRPMLEDDEFLSDSLLDFSKEELEVVNSLGFEALDSNDDLKEYEYLSLTENLSDDLD